MSLYYKENGERYIPEYLDGRTKQAFKDQCDINKMLKKAQQTGTMSHLIKYPELQYGEFNGDFDLLTAASTIERANEIFSELPSEVRKEFGNDALSFVTFAGNPENQGKLAEILPKIAEPGSFFPNPVKRGGVGAGAATAPVEPAAVSEPSPPAPEAPAAAGSGTDA